MKAIFTLLAALLVSTIPWSAASAQYPAQYAPQYPGYGMPASYAAPGAPVADGSVSTGAVSGGCASGDCGKHSLLHKLGLKSGCGAHGCSGNGCNGNGCNGGFCAALKGWLCRSYPSNAPRFGKPEYPLGFPTHPYLRSPRDYFMMDDP
jgi:hypothetical protein